MSEENGPHPNDADYFLYWNDKGTPYVNPVTHDMAFTLDAAMMTALGEDVTVKDAGGKVLWVGSRQAVTRGTDYVELPGGTVLGGRAVRETGILPGPEDRDGGRRRG